LPQNAVTEFASVRSFAIVDDEPPLLSSGIIFVSLSVPVALLFHFEILISPNNDAGGCTVALFSRLRVRANRTSATQLQLFAECRCSDHFQGQPLTSVLPRCQTDLFRCIPLYSEVIRCKKIFPVPTSDLGQSNITYYHLLKAVQGY